MVECHGVVRDNHEVVLKIWTWFGMIIKQFGAVAHLVERIVRNDEVAGSIPVSSTIYWLVRGCFKSIETQKILHDGEFFLLIWLMNRNPTRSITLHVLLGQL